MPCSWLSFLSRRRHVVSFPPVARSRGLFIHIYTTWCIIRRRHISFLPLRSQPYVSKAGQTQMATDTTTIVAIKHRLLAKISRNQNLRAVLQNLERCSTFCTDPVVMEALCHIIRDSPSLFLVISVPSSWWERLKRKLETRLWLRLRQRRFNAFFRTIPASHAASCHIDVLTTIMKPKKQLRLLIVNVIYCRPSYNVHVSSSTETV